MGTGARMKGSRRTDLPWNRAADGLVDALTVSKVRNRIMVNPGTPTNEPRPGGDIPGEVPPAPTPDETPDTGPTGPRTPYPVNDPGITDPKGPGSEPDYLPGNPTDPGTRY